MVFIKLMFSHTEIRIRFLSSVSQREDLGKQTIRNYILQIQGYRQSAERKLKKAYGSNGAEKKWCIATRNFIVPKEDIKYAKENGIVLLNEGQIDYFVELQKRIVMSQSIKSFLTCLKVTQYTKSSDYCSLLSTMLGEMNAYVHYN